MTTEKQPDLKTFIEDPQFEGDRQIMRGYMAHVLAEEHKKTQERRAKNEAPAGIFDTLFGWLGASEEHENAFDRAFSFTRRNRKQ